MLTSLLPDDRSIASRPADLAWPPFGTPLPGPRALLRSAPSRSGNGLRRQLRRDRRATAAGGSTQRGATFPTLTSHGAENGQVLAESTTGTVTFPLFHSSLCL